MKHDRNGFTIVELLIVIIVIAILASISVVSYGAIRNRARDTAITTEVANISQKLAVYSLANNNKYPSSLSEIDVTTPDDMTIDYSTTADKKGYYLVATIDSRSFSLSNQDNEPNKCNPTCVPMIDPSTPTGIIASSENPSSCAREPCLGS